MANIATFGEILLRISPYDNGHLINQTDNFRITVAGSEVNVAVALANLGVNTRCLSAISNDKIGDKIIRKIRENRVDTNYLIRAMGANGIFYNENGLSVRASDVIYDRQHSIFNKIEFDTDYFSHALDTYNWLHVTGITPGISKIACNNLFKAIQTAKEMKLMLSIDLNFRKKLWKWAEDIEIAEIYNRICGQVDCIIGNETDFQEALKIYGDNAMIAVQTFEKFNNLKFIAMSNRISYSASINLWNGFLHVRNKLNGFQSNQYELTNICDRVGTGDSFAAGIIYGLNNFNDYDETINFAAALSALNHTTIGDFSYFTLDDVNNILASKGNGRIIR